MKILFICTHNRCRSILAEAIANHFGEGLIEAASAGSEPADKVHPMTIKALQAKNIPVKGLHCKSWDEMEDFEADFVLTVCDNAAGESCPLWFGMSLRVHWGLEDPSLIEGSEEEILAAFNRTIEILTARIKTLAETVRGNPGRTVILKTLENLALQFKTGE